MGHFPFFMEMKGKKGIIAGGGSVAARKAEKLLAFGPALTVIAPAFEDSLVRLAGQAKTGEGASLRLLQRKIEKEDLEGAAFVIAATSDESVNAQISEYCRENHIPVNVADDREKCTFFFPALVKQGSLTIGISTDGKSPAAAAYVRARTQRQLPEGIGGTIELLGELREEVMQVCGDQKKRVDILEQLFTYSLRREGEVSLEELRSLLHGMAG